MTDLELLQILEGGARAAVVTWAAAAADAHDPRLRATLADLAQHTLTFQGKVQHLVRQLGGIG